MADTLRVAIFTDSALPVLNGVSVSIDALVRELRNQGHSVHLFCARYPGHVEHDPHVYRFRAIETPWTRGFPIAYPPFLRMLQRFRQHEFDIVHTHTIGVVSFVGLRWAESHGLPVVATYHTLYDRYAHYIPPLIPRRYVRWKIAKHTNYVFNRVRHVICPSEPALKWLRRHAVDTPATVIPTGAAMARPIDRAEARAALGVPDEHRLLLFVGRLAVEKNLETLFEATARVMRHDPRVRLCLVGDGPYRGECVRLARNLGIGDRVRFAGFVPRHEVDPYYAAADLFVFSSFTETQGLVVQEAMGYGLPTVTVQGGGASEAVTPGETGLVVRNDAEEFAQAVRVLLDRPDEARRMAANARRAVEGFGVGEMTRQVLQVYRSAIEAHRSGEPPKPNDHERNPERRSTA